MKQYISVNGGSTYIEYDPVSKTSEVIILSNVQKELSELETELANTPTSPSDSVLLEWARTNYPYPMDEQKRTLLSGRIAELQTILEAING